MRSTPTSRPTTISFPQVSPESHRSTSSKVIGFMSMGLIKTDPKPIERCHICKVDLEGTLLTSKKHTCRFCYHLTCAAHSMNRREQDGEAKRICDVCEMDHKRKEIMTQYKNEFDELNAQILDLEEAKDHFTIENLALASTIFSLESQLSAKIQENQTSFDRFQTQKQEITDKIAKAEQAKVEISSAIEGKRREIAEITGKCGAQETEKEHMESEVRKLVERKGELWLNLQEIQGKQGNSVSTKAIEDMLCEGCGSRLSEFQHARNHSSTTGGHERSMSIYSVTPSIPQMQGQKKETCDLL